MEQVFVDFDVEFLFSVEVEENDRGEHEALDGVEVVGPVLAFQVFKS